MPVKKISIIEFIELSFSLPVFDVRSPGEYNHAHIPKAYALPLFSDEERKEVGTAYKQQSKQKAIKIGVDFFGKKMRGMIESVETTLKKNQSDSNKLLLHCWRGGMRSAGVAWLLDLYGFDVIVLEGGYKAYRNWVLEQFEQEYKIKVLGGFTGSGKTELLQSLRESNENVIDLEALANHKGSAFGGIGQEPQPTQEMFENQLAIELYLNKTDFWLEDESQRIGRVNIPHPLWHTIRKAPVYFIDIPFHERLAFIEKNYGVLETEKLIEAVTRIQKRLGPLETKTTIQLLNENQVKEAFSILLKYYDKTYLKSLHTRDNSTANIHSIIMDSTNPEDNKTKLIAYLKNKNDRAESIG